ncbi:MAG TPA: DUF2059 domain-containing protein, partial [Candidatus Omnitrophota bacterium]|nr:DUF2059 domain-containing protein [Candidatus Omnitrophota bacterium]
QAPGPQPGDDPERPVVLGPDRVRGLGFATIFGRGNVAEQLDQGRPMIQTVRILSLAILLAWAASPVLAADSKAEKIVELMRLLRLDQIYTPEALIAPMIADLHKKSPHVPPEVMRIMEEEFGKEMPALAEFTARETIVMLDKYYTETEIDDLVTFYKSPTGQKSIAIMPQVMQDIMRTTQPGAARLVAGAVQRAMQRLEAMETKQRRSGGS